MSETTLWNYLLHTAPSLVVVMVLLYRSERHWERIEGCLERLLNDAWRAILEDRERGA